MSSSATETTDTAPLPQTGRNKSATLLFWILVAIPLFQLVMAPFLLCTAAFKKYIDPPWVISQTNLYEGKALPCDILVYGDSVAMTGLDPGILAATDKMSACNIAATGGVLDVLGLEPLDRYLERNPRPKILILHFAASNYHAAPVHQAAPPSTDGFIQLIRYSNWQKTLRVMSEYPESFIGILHYTYHFGGKQLLKHFSAHGPVSDPPSRGSYIVRPEPPLTSCQAYPGVNHLPDPAWIKQLRNKYSSRADRLLINVSPTSDCNPLYDESKKRLAGLTDNQFLLYPNSMFVDGAYHLTRAGAISVSDDAAAQIEATELQARQEKIKR